MDFGNLNDKQIEESVIRFIFDKEDTDEEI